MYKHFVIVKGLTNLIMRENIKTEKRMEKVNMCGLMGVISLVSGNLTKLTAMYF